MFEKAHKIYIHKDGRVVNVVNWKKFLKIK